MREPLTEEDARELTANMVNLVKLLARLDKNTRAQASINLFCKSNMC